MEMSPDIAELAAALAGFQGEMAPVAKTADNPFFKSKYADLASIVEAASPLASKHGLSVMQMPGWDGDNHTLSTVVLHTSGQWVRSEMVLMLPKQDPQGQGSALTYGRRYAYCAALGVVADADDDGNAAVSAAQSHGHTQQPRRTAGGFAGESKPATEKQVGYMRKLMGECQVGDAWIANKLGRPEPGELSMGDVSKLIDELHAMKKKADD